MVWDWIFMKIDVDLMEWEDRKVVDGGGGDGGG